MNYSEYIYLIRASFKSDFVTSLINILPSLFFAILSLILICICIVFFIEKINFNRNFDYNCEHAEHFNQRGNDQISNSIFILGIWAVLFSLLTVLLVPSMNNVKLDETATKKIYDIYMNKNVKQYEDDSSIFFDKFQYGSSTSLIRKETTNYNELIKRLGGNNLETHKLLNENIIDSMNSDFIKCLKENGDFEEKNMKIKEIEELIIKKENICLDQVSYFY